MKIWPLLFVVFFQFNTFAFELNLSDLNQSFPKISKSLFKNLQNPISVPPFELNECRKRDFNCLVHQTVIDLNYNHPSSLFMIEFIKENKILYKINFPNAHASSEILLTGKILGIKYKIPFQVDVNGLVLVENTKYPLPEFDGAGELQIIKNDKTFVLKSNQSLQLRIGNIKITPKTTLGRAARYITSWFFNAESEAQTLINAKLNEFLNGDRVAALLSEQIKQISQNSTSIALPLKDLGLQYIFKNAMVKTDNRQFNLAFRTDVKSSRDIPECHKNLDSFIIHSSSNPNLVNELTNINFNIPQRLFFKTIFEVLSHSLSSSDKNLSLLCHQKNELLKVGPFKLDFDWKIRPIKNMHFYYSPNENKIALKLRFFAETNSSKHPKIKLIHKESTFKKWQPGAFLDVRIDLQINHEDGVLKVSLDDVKIEKIDGKAKIILVGERVGLKYKLDPLKEKLDVELKNYLEENFFKEVKLNTSFNLSDDILINLDQFNLTQKGLDINFKVN